jgi:hypothetical protein
VGEWSTPSPGRFTPVEDPVPIVQEAGWAPGPVWTCAKNLAPTWIRSPDRPARSQSLYWLSYPARLLTKWVGICSVYTFPSAGHEIIISQPAGNEATSHSNHNRPFLPTAVRVVMTYHAQYSKLLEADGISRRSAYYLSSQRDDNLPPSA